MSAMNAGLLSSETDDWATPLGFFLGLDHEFHFELDVCASEGNAKVARYFDRETDGLAQRWAPSVCWMNPPYGRTISRWVEKAYLESQVGATVVGLVPARTDTDWWHKFVVPADDVRFIRGRLSFSGKGTAPFPSAVVVWRPVMHIADPEDTDTDEPTCGICGSHVDLYEYGWDHAKIESGDDDV